MVADTIIVDSGLGRGTVPPAVLRALLGVGVSGFSLSRCFRVRTFGGGTERNNPEVDHDELRALQKGILKKKAQHFKVETEVWNEVFNTLGSELVSRHMSRTEFKIVVQNHVDRFPRGGLVRNWLATSEPYIPN